MVRRRAVSVGSCLPRSSALASGGLGGRHTRGTRTDLTVAAVEHVAQLHHHGVAAHPLDVPVVLCQHPRHLEAGQRLLQVAVDVADCVAEAERLSPARRRGAGCMGAWAAHWQARAARRGARAAHSL